jgi:RHS repeat-associated protein
MSASRRVLLWCLSLFALLAIGWGGGVAAASGGSRRSTHRATPVARGVKTGGVDRGPSRRQGESAGDHGLSAEALGTEVPGLRTAKSDTFVNSHGLHTTRIFSVPVNFRDAQGKFQAINDALVSSGTGGFRNKANAYALSLPGQLQSGAVQVSKSGAWISMDLLGAHGAPAIAGNVADYKGALPGVTDSYAALSSTVKESLVLSNASAPSSFSYLLKASSGLTATTSPSGGIVFRDGARKVVFVLAAPFMTDAAGAESGQVAMSLKTTAAGWLVKVTASKGWLASPARKFPVTVDPTVEFDGAEQDCTITGGSSASTNLCPNPTLSAGYDGSKASRTLLQFDVGDYVPSDATVFNATLGLYLNSAQNSTSTSLSLYGLTHSWTTGATWNTYDGTNSWGSPGGVFDSTASATQTVGSTAGWYYWYPTSLVQDWVQGKRANDGMVVKEPSESTTQMFNFQATTITPGEGVGHTRGEGCCLNNDSPYLDVSYEERIGTKHFYDLQTQSLDDRMNESVNVAGGNLVVHNADLRVKGTGLNLGIDRYYNNQMLDTLDVGGGWNLSVGGDVQLISFGDGTVVYYDPSGAAWKFTSASGGGYTAPSGVDASLVKNSDGSYTLTYNQSQTKYNFGSDGLMTSEVDRNNNKISINYTTVDGLKSVSSVVDTQGRTTTFSYNSQGFISQMTDSSGRSYYYYYDSYGDLAEVQDPEGGLTNYYYDSYRDLVEILDPVGNATTFTYDSQFRVASVTRVTGKKGTGPTTSFSYGTGSGCASGDTNTVVTDPDGNKTTYCYGQYDLQGKIDKVIDALGHTRSKSYSSDADVQQYTSGSGSVLNAQYNSDNDLTNVQAPTGASWTLNYDTSGTNPYQPTSMVDPQGNTTSYQYDTNGNLNKITASNASTSTAIQVDHNSNGTVSDVIDANGNKTTYGYDGEGNLTSVTPPSPLGKETITYDGLSRVTSVTDGKGQKTTYAYDAMDRITKITYANGTSVSYGYDVDGNKVSRTDASGNTTTYTYDLLSRLVQQAGPSSENETYGYDAASNLSTFNDGGGTISYTYNPVNLVSGMTDADGTTFSFGYDKDNNRTTLNYPNGVAITNTYDASDRLTGTTAKNSAGTVLDSYNYGYKNPAGQDTWLRWTMSENSGSNNNYSYDALTRLTGASGPAGSYSYADDPNGNLTNYNGTTYGYNAANEITTSGYGFDADGNQTSGGGLSSLSYNAANQTTSITPNSGSAVALTYADNGQGALRTIGSTTLNDSLLGVTSQANSSGTSHYTRDNRGALLDERTPSGKYYYIADGLGSIVDLTNSSGAVVATYHYDPYGKTTSSSGSIANPWRYAGQYYDTTTGLYHMGARFYNPAEGRWTQQDPSGHIGDLQQQDAYPYAGDDPLNTTDPTGADIVSDVLGGLSTGASVVGDALDLTGVGAPVGAFFDAGSVLFSGANAAYTCATGSSDCGTATASATVAATTFGTASALSGAGYETAAAGVSGAGLGYDIGTNYL